MDRNPSPTMSMTPGANGRPPAGKSRLEHQPFEGSSPKISAAARVSALLHWVVVLATAAELGLGWLLQIWRPDLQTARLLPWLHGSLGASLAILLVFTLLWWLIAPPPRLRVSRSAWLGRALLVLSVCLYLLLPVTLASGYLAQVFAGQAVPLWTLSLPPWASPDPPTSFLLSRWHQWSAIALSGVILLYLLLRAWAVVRGSRRTGRASPLTRKSDASRAEPPHHRPTGRSRGLAAQLKIFGAVAFWLQVSLGLIAVLLLMVTASSNYYSENQLNLPSGISWGQGSIWAYLATGILAATIIGFYLCVRLARRLHAGIDPSRDQQRARRLVAGINFGSALGLTAAILGTAFSIALLIAKTISQPPGIAITDPQKIVRAVDVFVLLANFTIVVAHFVGVLTCLWILNRVHRLEPSPLSSRAGRDGKAPTPARA